MSDAPSFPELDDAAAQRVLALLVDVGASLALECKTPSEDVDLPARSEAFERIARAVRRTIILSQHIAQAAPARAAQDAARDAKRTLVRKQVIRAVEDSIQRNVRAAEADALRRELLERIDSPDFDEDVANRSPEQVIPEICRDLGLFKLPGTRPDLRRTPDDIAILCAQAAAPSGSGLPRWLAAAAPQAENNDTAREHAALNGATTLCDFILKER